ncbi:helix-turn-helix transcriptional regulator [Stappia taiwanensis]|uniref:Helix-turn-helix transcriptional regulator n=1 Tax=Stappia taiwanensis TaxID=992267 RepID=A0A838XQN7_9HYPH|nr:helix-turn-helix domain-containing protein [Stappia taiwanensis]MBA4613559.1 helix-turn-helix transcriptional regulator [Stappia taiwanensis]
MSTQKQIRTCSIWRALEVIGDASIVMIIEASWLGAKRFDQFLEMTGLRKALISARLKRLVEAGVMVKVPYSQRPPRYEYRLSQMGLDLYWVSLMMLRWERKWGSGKARDAVRLTHVSCGGEFEPVPQCLTCGEEFSAFDVSWREGPGVGLMPEAYARRRQHREAVAARPDGPVLMVEAAQIIGDRWASLVLRALFTGITSFEKIRADSGMATNILSERLGWLQSQGLVASREGDEASGRGGYRLTRKSIDYYPVLVMLLRWGDSYFAAAEGSPLLLFHGDNAHPLDAAVVCSCCRKPLHPHDVRFDFTPG